ncbi:polysaccharide deacetylase family protein [bacterium]|nr:polysaccharide deacetylase family protein [bacterium]
MREKRLIMAKKFCFRFDVDSIKCIKEGVPSLINLANKLGVKFTFFVNFGRAISYKVSLNKFINSIPKNVSEETPYKLSAKRKLGSKFYLQTAIVNPKVGASILDNVKDIYESGNEMGLHGGKNHSLWQVYGDKWSKDKIKHEIEWALGIIEKNGIIKPKGFASPGWSGSQNLNLVLDELGFSYVADDHAPDSLEIYSAEKGHSLLHIPTNITGEGGVGYIEAMIAEGLTPSEIAADFRKRLCSKSIAVVYDHPYFAGVEAKEIVPRLIDEADKAGFEITTMQEMVKDAR